MSQASLTVLPPGQDIKPKTSRDDWIMRGFIAMIAVYLVVALALPLYTMLSKAFETYEFDLSQYEFQVSNKSGVFDGTVLNAAELNTKVGAYDPSDLAAGSGGRLKIVALFPDFSFRSTVRYKVRGVSDKAVYLFGSERHTGPDWMEFDSNQFRKVVLRPDSSNGFSNFKRYFSTPSLVRSISNSLMISVISTIITVSLAFGFAYSLARSKMRFKGLFRLIAMAPILVPSLLPSIALVYLFGNQGILKVMMMGESIYGPYGIVAGSVFFTFPHAMLIISTGLAISDARLYEAAKTLRASAWRTFWTVTIPGARYGLISVAFVVFNLVITDYGLPQNGTHAVPVFGDVTYGHPGHGFGSCLHLLLQQSKQSVARNLCDNDYPCFVYCNPLLHGIASDGGYRIKANG